MHAGLALGASGKDQEAKGQEQVFQHFQIPCHGLALDLTLARDVADVEHRCVRETHRFQKAGKAPNVARPAFELHLFLEIERRIGAQHLVWLRRRHDQGQEPVVERGRELKAGELCGHKWMHAIVQRPACQQINPTTPEFARTRPGQHKALRDWLLDQGMHHIEEFWHALDLVYYDRIAVRCAQHEGAEPLRACAHLPIDVRLQQIYNERLRKLVPEPGRFPSTARPKEEETLGRNREKTTLKFHFASQKGKRDSRIQEEGSGCQGEREGDWPCRRVSWPHRAQSGAGGSEWMIFPYVPNTRSAPARVFGLTSLRDIRCSLLRKICLLCLFLHENSTEIARQLHGAISAGSISSCSPRAEAHTISGVELFLPID